MTGINIGVVGATGLVGRELISILENSNIRVGDLKLFASERSEGVKVAFKGSDIEVYTLTKTSADGLDYAFFCSDCAVSEKFVPIFSKKGIICIDNSSKYRLDESVPLVIPEINSKILSNHRNVIANPNCSTIIALMALYPLHKKFAMNGFCVSTYQAVSGVGRCGLDALHSDLKSETESSVFVFGEQIAYNAIPVIGNVDDYGYSVEENKMCNESRKILERNDIRISSMCVRVPVLRAHSMSIFASFDKDFDLSIAADVLRKSSHVSFFEGDSYPSAVRFSGKNICGVGRLRKDIFLENGASMWVVGDQIRKGAALNAFQIMLVLENL